MTELEKLLLDNGDIIRAACDKNGWTLVYMGGSMLSSQPSRAGIIKSGEVEVIEYPLKYFVKALGHD